MTLTVAVILTIFAFVRLLRPRAGVRLSPSPQAGCGEFTILLSYDSLRLRLDGGRPRLMRRRRNVLLAGYGWNEPRL